jgi:multiple sugar transport system substrate-binding protein
MLLLLSVLTGCVGAPSEPTPGGDPPTPNAPAPNDSALVTISFAAWEADRARYEALAQQFMAENPTINVVIVSLDNLRNISEIQDDTATSQMLLRAIVSGADTAPADALNQLDSETLSSGLLLNLAPQMEADAAFDRDDFYAGALERYTFDGGAWLLPAHISVQTLGYNKDLFAEAGLPEPTPGWTWNDVLGAAEQLAKTNGGEVETYGYAAPYLYRDLLPLLALLEEQGVDVRNMQPANLQLDRSEVLNAVTRMRDLIQNGALFSSAANKDQAQPDVAHLIREGRVGIWDQDMFQTSGVISVDTDDATQPQALVRDVAIGTAPYPNMPLNILNNAQGFVVSAGTAHPTESWKWIEFLSRQNLYTPSFVSQPGRIPARQSVAEATGFWGNIDEETAAAYQWAIANQTPMREQLPDLMVLDALGAALEQIVRDQREPYQALQDAQRHLAERLAEAQLTPTPEVSAGPVIIATLDPQTAPDGATTVTFLTTDPDPAKIRRLGQAFHAQRPDIFVQIQVADQTQSATLQGLAETSDCFSWYRPPQRDDDFQALLDLQPLFDADASFPHSDFAPLLLAPYQRESGLYGLPDSVMLRTLKYHRAAFDAAGLTPPAHQWTSDDFLAAAQMLTKGEGANKHYGYVPLNNQDDLLFFIHQFGGQIVRGSGADIRPNFTDPNVIAAIQWYLELATTHHVMPTPTFVYKRDDLGLGNQGGASEERVDGHPDLSQLILDGRAGMWFDRSGQGLNVTVFEVGSAPLPVGQAGLSVGDVFMSSMHIAAKTQPVQQQACWEWLKFLTSNVDNAIPARASVRASETFATQAPPDVRMVSTAYDDILKQQSEKNDAYRRANDFYALDTYWFFKALSEAVAGTTELTKGLTEAQEFTDAYMECLSTNPNQFATCATQVDPDYQGFRTTDASPAPERVVTP